MSLIKIISIVVCGLLALAFAGAAIYVGIVARDEGSVAIWLTACAIPSAVIYEIVRGRNTNGSSIPPSAKVLVAAIFAGSIANGGCAGAAVAADEVLTEACIAAGDEIVEAREAGTLEQPEAEAQHECLQAACLSIHRQIERAVDSESEK